MKLRLISLGQTASQEPVTEQLPKPSASIWLTMLRARRSFSALPCGSRFRCETLAATKSMAEAFLQTATHAPQPMHAAASIESSAAGLGTGIALASGAPPVLTEVKLASRRAALSPVRDAVDDQRTHAADALAAIGVKGHRLLAGGDEALVHH